MRRAFRLPAMPHPGPSPCMCTAHRCHLSVDAFVVLTFHQRYCPGLLSLLGPSVPASQWRVCSAGVAVERGA
jgi:hypothetical protein